MIVRFCYAVYLELLNQHNQEFRPYTILSFARSKGESGNETRPGPYQALLYIAMPLFAEGASACRKHVSCAGGTFTRDRAADRGVSAL